MHGIIIIGDGSEKYPVVEQIIDDAIITDGLLPIIDDAIITDGLLPIIDAEDQDLSGNGNTASFTFTSSQAGYINIISDPSYTVNISEVIVGLNTIEFNNIDEGTYDISFTVTDITTTESSTYTIPSFTINRTPPVISDASFIDMSGTDINPSFKFESDEAGTINIIPTAHGVTPTSVIDGSNTITFDSLPRATYDLSFSVTDLYGNITDTKIPEFTISEPTGGNNY